MHIMNTIYISYPQLELIITVLTGKNIIWYVIERPGYIGLLSISATDILKIGLYNRNVFGKCIDICVIN